MDREDAARRPLTLLEVPRRRGLTDAWEAGSVFPGGISHPQHVRIAWVLHHRHRAEEEGARLLAGTKRACEVHGCLEKFDAALTKRWSEAIAAAIKRDGPGDSADEFLAAHPELTRGDLLGRPADRPANWTALRKSALV